MRERPSARVQARDGALRRLQRIRVVLTALTVIVTVAFVQAAAGAFPGRAQVRVRTRVPARVRTVSSPPRRAAAATARPRATTTPGRRHRRALTRPAATPPTTQATQTQAPATTTSQAPAPAAAAPAPTVVSGGS